MKIVLAKKAERGYMLQQARGLARRHVFTVGNAVVLTGANGVGKTALLDGIALSCGLAKRYATSETTYALSGLESSNSKMDVGGVTLTDDDSEPLAPFDLILRYRGEDTRARPLVLDTLEDMRMIMGPKGSHGQVALNRLGKLLREAEGYLKKPKKRLLLLLDEPETAAAPDILLRMVDRLYALAKRAGRMQRFVLVVVTQSPFLLFALERAKATRIDLGGWAEDIDPFPALLVHAEDGYRACVQESKATKGTP